MAVYTAPADTRWGDMGRGLNKGLLMGMQRQNQQEDLERRYELANQAYQDKAEFDQKQKQGMLDRTFGYQPMGAVGPDMFVQGQVTPEGTGLTPQMLEMMKIQAQTGVNPMSYLPKEVKPSFAYKEGNIFQDGERIGGYDKPLDTRPTSSFGKWATDLNLPMNMETFKQFKTTGAKPQRPASTSNLNKLISEQLKFPEGSREWNFYEDNIQKITTEKMSPLEKMMMIQLGLDPNDTTGGGADTNLSVDDILKNY